MIYGSTCATQLLVNIINIRIIKTM